MTAYRMPGGGTASQGLGPRARPGGCTSWPPLFGHTCSWERLATLHRAHSSCLPLLVEGTGHRPVPAAACPPPPNPKLGRLLNSPRPLSLEGQCAYGPKMAPEPSVRCNANDRGPGRVMTMRADDKRERTLFFCGGSRHKGKAEGEQSEREASPHQRPVGGGAVAPPP